MSGPENNSFCMKLFLLDILFIKILHQIKTFLTTKHRKSILMLLKKQEVRWNTANTFTSPMTPTTAGGILPPRMILKALAPGLPPQLRISAFLHQ